MLNPNTTVNVVGNVQTTSDYSKKSLLVEYSRSTKRVYDEVRRSIKWLIIKAAEQSGHSFLHASACRYRGKLFLFSGHSGYGKSSCLYRLASLGGSIISDDNVLLKDESIIHYYLKPTIKGDFQKRFNLKNNTWKLKPGVNKTTEPLERNSILVFPKVWLHKKSAVTPVSSLEAQKRLDEIYFGETHWNAVCEHQRKTQDKHRKLTEKLKCFDFYAGSNESDIRKTLLTFSNKIARN